MARKWVNTLNSKNMKKQKNHLVRFMQIFKVFKCILKVVNYCIEVKKKHFNKYLVITKKDEDFEISKKIDMW